MKVMKNQKKLLNHVEEKSPEIINECVLKKQVLDNKKILLLKERNESIEKAISNNTNKEEIKKMLKDYNL